MKPAGLFVEPDRAHLRVTGSDRSKYLNSMLTNEVKSLAPGQGTVAFALTVKAHPVALVRLLVRGDDLLLDTDAVCRETLLGHLRKFIVINQVEIEDVTGSLRVFGVEGEAAGRALADAAGGPLPELPFMGHTDARIGGADVTVLRMGYTSGGFRVYTGADRADHVRESLDAAVAGVGGGRLSDAESEALRIGRGWPAWGREIDDETLPPSLGIDDVAIHYTKGCYLGQEPIARLHFRGSLQRRLMGLYLEGAEPAAPGDPVFGADGAELGRVTSTTARGAEGPVALAFLRREAFEPGTAVEVGEARRRARTAALPLEGS